MKLLAEYMALAGVTVAWIGAIAYGFGGWPLALPVLCSGTATVFVFAVFNRDLFR